MQTRSEAEEHLRVIRSLMEKATIYRAISAPTALVGGVTSVVVGAALAIKMSGQSATPEGSLRVLFLAGWLGVLAVTAAANTVFLWRDARRRGDVFVSAGMRAAVLAFSPSYLTAAFFTVLFAPGSLPSMWMIFYGLGLLATQHFAPRSIALLGWAFLAAGMLVVVLELTSLVDGIRNANLSMIATFGLFHLIYAACTWPRKSAGVAAGGTP